MPVGSPKVTPPISSVWSEPVLSSMPSAVALKVIPLAFQKRVEDVTRSS